MIAELQAKSLNSQDIVDILNMLSKRYALQVLHANYRMSDANLYLLVSDYKAGQSLASDMTDILIGLKDKNGDNVIDNDLDLQEEYCPVVKITQDSARYSEAIAVRGGEDLF